MNLFKKSLLQRRFEPAVRVDEARAMFVKRASYFVILALVASFLFLGCPDNGNPEDTGFIPVGEWVSYDSYTITENTIDYFMAGSEYEGVVYPDTVLKGNIEKAVDFSGDAGVLIIKITEATYNTVGKYTGVYYSEYSSSSIKMATAYEDGSVEADTLTAALSLFTVDNVGNHVSMWGSYTK